MAKKKAKKLIISEPLKEALIEMARVMVLAIVPLALIQLEQGQVDYIALAVAGMIAGLRFIDKYLHLVGKERGESKLTTGLTRF